MTKKALKRKIDIAAGREKPQRVLKNCKIVNVFTNEIIKGDIAIDGGKIVGIGEYKGIEEIYIDGKYVAPGFIDGHVHIESSMTTPQEFAKIIIPRGTTTIIADPHEIANVCGVEGIKYMLQASQDLPLNVYMMLPSCVPATPFENAGAVLEAKELEGLLDDNRVLGLGELMNYPGVISTDDKVMDKIVVAGEKMIDGHGPNIKDKELNAYVVAGVKTEHECSTVEEMLERLRLGMYILIREGSAARNLKDLVRAVNKDNLNRCLFCTDDKHPEDLIRRGHIDNNLRMAVKAGINPIDAIKMATINAANCYELQHVGAIAPGYSGDLVVLEDLKDFHVIKVFKEGNLVAENNKSLFQELATDYSNVTNTVNMREITAKDLQLQVDSDIVKVIKLLPHSLVTERVIRKVETERGIFKYHKSLDILKMAVIERHHAKENIGLGLVEDFQLKGGAIASTIAHDSHNLIVIGDNDEDMLLAIDEIKKVGGGITICSEGNVLDTLALPIAGLMSNACIYEVNKKLTRMLDIAYNQLKVNQNIDPFMTLSFLALPVIPQIKLTDMGLFDVDGFKFTDISL